MGVEGSMLGWLPAPDLGANAYRRSDGARLVWDPSTESDFTAQGGTKFKGQWLVYPPSNLPGHATLFKPLDPVPYTDANYVAQAICQELVAQSVKNIAAQSEGT